MKKMRKKISLRKRRESMMRQQLVFKPYGPNDQHNYNVDK